MTLPMSYASVSDVYGCLTFIGSSTNVSSSLIANHGGRVQSIIDAKLGKNYAVPFSAVPPIVNTLCTDLTCYYVLAGTAILANTLKDSPWPQVYKDSMKMLDQLASGEMALISGSGTVIADIASTNETIFSNTQNYNQTFQELDFEISEIDPMKVDDRINEL